jgi:hypothetical protein
MNDLYNKQGDFIKETKLGKVQSQTLRIDNSLKYRDSLADLGSITIKDKLDK